MPRELSFDCDECCAAIWRMMWEHRGAMSEVEQEQLKASEELSATVAWQSRDFRFYSAARVIGIMGAEAQAVGVAWQVYQITHSALALGYTGAVRAGAVLCVAGGACGRSLRQAHGDYVLLRAAGSGDVCVAVDEPARDAEYMGSVRNSVCDRYGPVL
jgi:hypothetical protein